MPRTAVPVRWAVQEVVRIRAESGCLRPGEDVAGQRSVFLVVVRAKRGRRHRTVALATSGSEPASWVALSVSMLFRSNTPIFRLSVPLKNRKIALSVPVLLR